MRDRILDAAQRLVFRVGARKLSMSDVATMAGVSRPTIYRYFVSKEAMIDGLGKREYRRFIAAMATATAGLTGAARLEAAVDVVATFVEDQPPGRLLDLEPGFAHDQMARALPMMTDGLGSVVATRDLAGAIARTALSHYMFPDDDPMAARRQLRATAGLPDRRVKRSAS